MRYSSTMLGTRIHARHRGAAILGLAIASVALATGSAQTTSTGSADFVILFRGARVGSESVTVERTGSGWLIAGSGRTTAPVELVTERFEAAYAADWQPQRLVFRGQARGQGISLETSFGVTTATSDMTQGAERGTVAHQITPRSIVLPASFFGAYEALALRLDTAAVGTRLPAYIPPTGETSVTVDRQAPRRVSTGTTTLELREFGLTINTSGVRLPLEIWIDARGRLARLVMPTSSLVVLRDDLAGVMAREVPSHHPGDEEVFAPANGFSLSATLSKPPTGPAKLPAIVLVAPPGVVDRDVTVFGISVFGQLAGALADAGYAVLRYDSRGIGRSGGRTESATLNEYAEDVIQAINWLRKRRDIDADRISVAGYAEGGAVSLIAASREKRIKAVALVASAGRTGREVAIEQQQDLLSRLKVPETERAARIALQNRVMDAVVAGRGWEGIAPDVRASADSPWFRSWLLFDPAVVLQKVNQPLLVLHGSLDRELAPSHGERLATLARGRKKAAPAATRHAVIAGANHLMVPATTGEIDEYGTLTSRTLMPDVAGTIASWLRDVVPPRQ